MNTLKQITLFFLIIGLYSCSKEDTEIKENPKKTINKKWIVENSAEYKSIEFDTNGNYIIIKNKNTTTSKIKNEENEIFIFGTYEILDTDILFLSNFGTMKFDDSDPNNIKFSIKYEGSNTYTYDLNVSESEEFASTPKTDLLCNTTWKLTRKEEGKDTINLINFSKTGTCIANFSIITPNHVNSIEFGKWKWVDNEETKIIITQIKNTYWIVDRDGEAEFEINNISGARLELKQVFNNKIYNIAFDSTTVSKNKTSKKLKRTF